MQFLECIEKSLNFELTPSSLDRINLNHSMLGKLSKDLNKFYSTYDFPEKEENTIRPFLSPHYDIGDKIQWSVKNPFSDHFKNKFSTPSNYRLTDICKRHLLYAHSISYEDPLIYLTDYFDYEPSKHSESRIPAIKFLLKEYAQMRPLLEKNYIVPFAYNKIAPMPDNPYFLDENEIEILRKFTKSPTDNISLLSSTILKDLDLSRKLDHRIDLYFPNKTYVEIYAAILKSLQKNFTSKNIIQPLLSGTIGQINGIKINAVTIEDLKNIRENEETFKVWRDFTQEILTELYKTENLYSDQGQEFLDIAQLKFKEVDAKIKGKFNNSPVLKDLTSTIEQSIIGVSVGAMAGVLSGTSSVNSMITGGIAPFIKLVLSCFKDAFPINNNISLNNHFLVFDLK
jgi:hypothetical protein